MEITNLGCDRERKKVGIKAKLVAKMIWHRICMSVRLIFLGH